MKRPPTVWLTQAFLIFFALLFLSLLLMNIIMLLTDLEREFSLIRTVVGYSVIVGFIVLLLVAFWGLVKRAKYGRWLGVVSLMLIWALVIFVHVSRPSGPTEYYEYQNNTQLAGGILANVLLHGLIVTLILRLSFSRKIGEFFA